MALKIFTVLQKKGKWFNGYISKGRFHKNQELTRRSDVKNINDYITLKQFLKKHKDSPILNELDVEKVKAENIYLLNQVIGLPKDFFEVMWWGKFNKKCESCKEGCKQSYKVVIEKCSKYVKI